MARRRRYSRRKSSNFLGLWLIVFAFIIKIFYHVFLGVMAFVDWITGQMSNWSAWHWVLSVLIVSVMTYTFFRIKRKRKIRATLAEIKSRKQKIKRYEDMQQLKSMDPFDFEEYIAELFKLMGYEATVTRKTGDGGKDIILRKGGQLAIAECKRYNALKVTRPDVQKFHSALVDMKAREGFYITTGNSSKPPVEYVSEKNIQLIDGNKLMSLIEKFSNELI